MNNWNHHPGLASRKTLERIYFWWQKHAKMTLVSFPSIDTKSCRTEIAMELDGRGAVMLTLLVAALGLPLSAFLKQKGIAGNLCPKHEKLACFQQLMDYCQHHQQKWGCERFQISNEVGGRILYCKYTQLWWCYAWLCRICLYIILYTIYIYI